jgi:hypothetical protein
MLAMPIAQVITFLNFKMSYLCKYIFYPMFTHLYPHGTYRINDDIYIYMYSYLVNRVNVHHLTSP